LSDDVTIQVRGLDALLKALKGRQPKARVGILGSKAFRKGLGPTNAEIGAAHEFGTSSLPQRSFLRIPLHDHLEKEMQRSNLFSPVVLANVVKNKNVIPWLEQMAIAAEAVVADAFDSGGFGKWPAWSNPSYKNATGMVLVDSQQLRNSITSEVKE
jgi:phage gpG-like protein